MIYGTTFIFSYMAEILFERYNRYFAKHKAIFGGASLGLSLSVVIFIVEKSGMTGISDGRFCVILIGASFFGAIGGGITAGTIFLLSLMNNYHEIVFLLISILLYYSTGLLIYQNKDKKRIGHLLMNIISAVLLMFLSLAIASVMGIKPPTTSDNMNLFIVSVVLVTALFTYFLSEAYLKEMLRTRQLKKLNKHQRELLEKNKKITELNEQLFKSENRYKMVMQASDEGFVEYNHYMKTLVVSERVLEIFDYLIDDTHVSLWKIFELMDEKDAKKVQEEFGRLKVSSEDIFNINVRIKQRDDERKYVAFRGIVIRKDGTIISVIGSIKDIHDKVIKEQIIFDLAYKDEITGLYNENAFMKDLNEQLKYMHSGHLLFISIGGYSNYGLVGVSYRNIIRMHLSSILKKSFTIEEIYYLQEGSFCVHIGGYETFPDLQERFDQLTKELSQPVRISDIYIPIHIHGIFFSYPYMDLGTEGILARGLSALSIVEKNNVQRLVLFDEDIYNKHLRMTQIESHIAKALANNELYMAYQPQYDSKGEYIIGYEALVRWNSDDFGRVSPAEFIPIAEKTGTVYRIGQFVIRSVCNFMNEYLAIHKILPTVSVNASFMELINPNYAEEMNSYVRYAKISPENIVIEITETSISEFLDIVLTNIRLLREYGFKIHLDDFGTGYSSLNHLSRLSIDCIKIDKSFISELSDNQRTNSLVQSMIELAHRIGIEVIAEGIETNEQLSELTKMQCDAYQGYLFSKPLSREALLEESNEITVNCRYKK